MMRVLPDDVLLLIGDFLEDHRDRYNLVFVCRRFHDLFLRLAYRAASLKSCQHLRSFLGSILRRPELAWAVRVLHFDHWQDKQSTGHVNIANEERPLLTDWTRDISQSDEEHAQWEQDLQYGVSDAWIALLLPLVSNLRQLRLIYPRHNTYLDRTLYRAVNGECPAFRSLQEVSLSHLEDDADDTKGNYLPSQILPFFQLPLMHTLSADMVLESDSAQEARGSPPSNPLTDSPSSISEITLNASNGSKGMQSLIASCSSLKSFKYQHSDSHLHAEGYQPSAFYHSLAGKRNTLETLWLDNCGQHLPFTIAGANETHDEWFGSLTEFTALKDMRIRLPNLLDVRYQLDPSTPLPDILPHSLESLYIEGCKENTLSMLLNQVRMVLGRRTSRFPALRRVDIEGFFHDEEEDSGYDGASSTTEKVIKPRVYEMVKPVRVGCAEAGIDLFLRDRVCLETMKGSPV
ncbi:uncharacterized protein ASPGLDRAFT_73976 [Aspergillus glaucus CBS 516.65]|uniref:F-box domain-containing protein n=1 Tax=Aspergillus glaucus CBS 516.65 TaxID=1160497 RepID=A0A1L9VKN4_ASPGL|nr:hypothetical protein ASPGLDRAFT_73976 [Aspergillus glaucus CBS 516.65]OJJ84489.1 hypothetical protein ASPGLDRAFT_73976 [Aspergillus glaucus CBS 516.65]